MMESDQPSKRLARPDLRVNANKWSRAQKGTFTTRVAIFATITAVISGISLVFIYPYLNIDRFQKIQKVNRAGINPEDTQPAGLPIWRDPFDRKKAG